MSHFEDITRVGRARRCHLLELPPELRLRIYEAVFSGSYNCAVVVEGDSTCLMQWSQFDTKHKQRHLLALLMTCRTILNEAASVLNEATRFDIQLTDVPLRRLVRTRYNLVGALNNCVFFDYIQNVGVLSICRESSSTDDFAHLIEQFVAMLPSHRRLGMLRISLLLGETSSKEADPVVRALTGLKCKPGASLDLGRAPRDCWREDSVSEDLLSEFEEKCGIAAVEVKEEISPPPPCRLGSEWLDGSGVARHHSVSRNRSYRPRYLE